MAWAITLAFCALPLLAWDGPLLSASIRWILMLAGYTSLGALAFYHFGMKIPWSFPVLGFCGAMTCRLFFEIFRELKSRQEIEEFNRTRKILGNMLVHDIRSPLNCMMLAIQSVLPAQEDPKFKRRLEIAVAEGRRLSTLLESFLDIQRMESNRMQLNRSRFCWGALTQEIVARLTQRAEELNIQLGLHARGDLRDVYADRQLMNRVLSNLIDNAIDFASPGTTVLIESSIQGTEESSRVLTRIINHGPILNATAQRGIFEVFSQGQQKDRNSNHRGFGLGLMFCKLTILAHGGKIQCISPAPGLEDGVCMELSLPLVSYTPANPGMGKHFAAPTLNTVYQNS